MEPTIDTQTGEEIKCAYCPHSQSDHFDAVLLVEADADKSSKAGLCKVFTCECIQFTAINV